MTIVSLVHLASTCYMVGLIWFVQVVHYPLLGRIGEDTFVRCQAFHLERTSFVVGPPMLAELASGLALYWMSRDQLLLASLVLLVLVWFSTFFLQVPKHRILAAGFHPGAHSMLVRWNWVRTVAWSARGFLVLAWFTRTIRDGAMVFTSN